ncbi:MAG: SDR family NAD(P)-dependent oxidoreductase [Acidobacteriota bacterium]
MGKIDFKDKWVIVTGASSGLGEAIALELAEKESANLVITARRVERLGELKNRIENEFNREVIVIGSDLADPESVKNLFKKSIDKKEIFAIINNAGMTDFNPAVIEDFEKYNKIIEVNLLSLMRLSLLFLDYFGERGEGAILNITSMGAFFPLVYQGAYVASKHGAQVFTEILSKENKNKNIVISSFAPGGIATEMLSSSGLDKLRGADDFFNWSAERVAAKAVKSFKKKKLLSVPGFVYKLMLFLKRFMTKKALLRMAEKTYRKK